MAINSCVCKLTLLCAAAVITISKAPEQLCMLGSASAWANPSFRPWLHQEPVYLSAHGESSSLPQAKLCAGAPGRDECRTAVCSALLLKQVTPGAPRWAGWNKLRIISLLQCLELLLGSKQQPQRGLIAITYLCNGRPKKKGKGMFMGLKHFLQITDLVERDKCPHYYFSLFD